MKEEKIKKNPIYVKFYDHYTGTIEPEAPFEDAQEEGDFQDQTVSIVGWVIKETKNYLVVALNLGERGDSLTVKYYWAISKPAIIERKEIQTI